MVQNTLARPTKGLPTRQTQFEKNMNWSKLSVSVHSRLARSLAAPGEDPGVRATGHDVKQIERTTHGLMACSKQVQGHSLMAWWLAQNY